MTRQIHRILSSVLSFVVAVSVLGFAPAAAADDSGPVAGITGIVADASGHGFGGVAVTLYANGDPQSAGESVATAPDGSFAFTSVPDGQYSVGAGGGPLALPQKDARMMPEGDDPRLVTVAEGTSTQRANVTYTGARGFIRDLAGEPLDVAGVNVFVEGDGSGWDSDSAGWDSDSAGWDSDTVDWDSSTTGWDTGTALPYAPNMDYTGNAKAADTGEFFLPLGPGTYYFHYYAMEREPYSYGAMWTGGTTVARRATPVEVTDTEVLEAGVQFSEIHGVVRDPDNQPLPGATVQAKTPGRTAATATTGADGAYRLLVPRGDYTVRFASTFNDTHYGSYFFPGTYQRSRATTLTAGDAAAVADGRFIRLSGTVRNDDGTPRRYAGIHVLDRAVDREWEATAAWGYSRRDGSYDVYTYPGRFSIEGMRWSRRASYSTWYGENSSAFGNAEVVDAREGSVSGLDMTFRVIRGSVVNESKDGPVPAGGVRVYAFDRETQNYAGYARTNAAGEYELGVPSGDYIVEFYAGRNNFQFYDGVYRMRDATAVPVRAAASANDINATMKVFEGYGKISGRITLPNGEAPAGGWVSVGSAGNYGSSFTDVNTDGTYELTVPSGRYFVSFTAWDAERWGQQYYPSQAHSGDAIPVETTSEAYATNVDAVFHEVTGTISVASQGYRGGVALYGTDGTDTEYIGDASADDDGTYSALAPADTGLTAQFNVYNDTTYAAGSTFYGSKPRAAEAARFDVADGGATNINQHFELVMGRAADTTGFGVPDVWTTAVNADPNASVDNEEDAWNDGTSWAVTGNAGSYEMPVGAGDYKVMFQRWLSNDEDSYDNLETQWFDRKPTHAEASVVSVERGVLRTGVNAVFARPGGLTGKVTTADGTSIPNVCVTAWNGGTRVGSTTTRADGTYNMNLRSGTYTVKFIHCVSSPVYKDQWFSNATTQAAASPVALEPQEVEDLGTTVLESGFQATPPIATTETGGSGTTTVDPRTGVSTTTMPWGDRSDVTVVYTIPLAEGQTITGGPALLHGGKTFPMTLVNGTTYTGTIPARDVTTGPITVDYSVDGTSPEPTKIGTITLYDPSGDVTNSSTGEAVAGATVTLYQVPGWAPKQFTGDDSANTCQSNLSKPHDATWNQPVTDDMRAIATMADPDSGLIRPRVNPQKTNAAGRYGWDVAAGCWFVTVEAAGYRPFTSPVVGVPPEVTNLDVALQPLAIDGPTNVNATANQSTATIEWTAPKHRAISAVEVHVNRQDATAPTALDNTKVCEKSASQTACTTTVEPGKDYAFSVFSREGSATYSAAGTDTLFGTLLTTPQPRTIQHGSSTTISGQLKKVNNDPLHAKGVVLQKATTVDGETVYEGVGDATTSEDGSFSFTVTPDATTRYRVAFASAGKLIGNATEPVQVTVNPKTTALTLSATSKVVNTGGSTTLKGALTAGTGFAGEVILSVSKQAANKSWSAYTTLTKVQSAASGSYSYTTKPTGASRYKATFVGTATRAESEAALVQVDVLPRVTMNLNKTKIRAGSSITVTGSVAPKLAGKVVYLQVNGKDVASTKLTSTSTFKFVRKMSKKGTFKFAIRVPAYAPYLGAKSAQKALKVS